MSRFLSPSARPAVGLNTFGILLVILFASAYTQPASSQGLFERLRERREARRAPAPVQPPPQSSQRPMANQPRVTPQPPNQPPAGYQQPVPVRIPPTPASNTPPLSSTPMGSADAPSFGIEVVPGAAGAYQGLQVMGFTPDSPAAIAGLRRGDVIVSIEDQRITSLADAADVQQRLEPGQQASVQLFRDGKLYQTEITTESSRSAAKPPVFNQPGTPTLARTKASLGLEARNASPQRGVNVVTVNSGSAGEIAGIRAEDRIVAADGRLVRDIDDLMREISLKNPGDEVMLGIARGDSMLELDVELGGPGGVPTRAARASDAVGFEQSVLGMPNGGDAADEGGNSNLAAGPTDPFNAKADSSQPNTSQPNTSQPDSAQPASILEGMTSTLGDFFSGPKPKNPPNQPNSKPVVDQTDTLPAPKAKQLGEAENDPLALPDDAVETAEPTSLAEPTNPGNSSETLPMPKPTQSEPKMTEVERLRAEVAKLKAELGEK